MHASIRRYIVASGREADAIKHASTGFLPILRRVPGFVAYYFVNTGDGEMLGISVFQTREGAIEANRQAAVYVNENIGDILNRTSVLEGDVVAHANEKPG